MPPLKFVCVADAAFVGVGVLRFERGGDKLGWAERGGDKLGDHSRKALRLRSEWLRC